MTEVEELAREMQKERPEKETQERVQPWSQREY